MAADRVLLSDGTPVLLADGTPVLLSTTTPDNALLAVVEHRSPDQTASFRALSQAVTEQARSKAIAAQSNPAVNETSTVKSVAYQSPNQSLTEG